jgi:DivIVA domain-containing protein
MYHERIVLTSQDVLEKDFKIDTRGYRPQEVDRFLDTIIKDYEEMSKIINELESDKQELADENLRLKKELRNLKSKLELATENDSQGASGVNADLLRRLSNLEKIIYGKE